MQGLSFRRLRQSHCVALTVALLSASLLTLFPVAVRATELPPTVLQFLKQKDPNVKVRFDGLVTMSNGESYVPVIQQDPVASADPQKVLKVYPATGKNPDLIEFDNHFFLLRLIQTSTGRLTFPKLESDYPLALKEGLLPQDFVLPANLYIPVELKVILGALPYNPTYTPSAKPPVVPVAKKLEIPKTPAQVKVEAVEKPVPAGDRLGYVYDMGDQQLIAINPDTGKQVAEVTFGTVPASLTLSPDGQYLYAPSLSSNELIVVDTQANLIKTRIPVGQHPEGLVILESRHQLLVSNRFSPFVSVVETNTMDAATGKIDLPGNGDAMTVFPGANPAYVAVADAVKPAVYLINLQSGTVEKTLKALPDISAMTVVKNDKGALELWVASRTDQKIMAIDPQTGLSTTTIAVGNKPVGFAQFGAKLYVLSAGDAEIDVVDLASRTKLPAVPLPADSFPSGFAVIPSQKLAYVTTANGSNLIYFNLATGQVEKTLTVDFRASLVAITPDSASLFEPADGSQPVPVPSIKPATGPDGLPFMDSDGNPVDAGKASSGNPQLPQGKRIKADKHPKKQKAQAETLPTTPEALAKPVSVPVVPAEKSTKPVIIKPVASPVKPLAMPLMPTEKSSLRTMDKAVPVATPQKTSKGWGFHKVKPAKPVPASQELASPVNSVTEPLALPVVPETPLAKPVKVLPAPSPSPMPLPVKTKAPFSWLDPSPAGQSITPVQGKSSSTSKTDATNSGNGSLPGNSSFQSVYQRAGQATATPSAVPLDVK